MKFLVVGLGAIGQRHVRNLRALYGEAIELLAYRARGLTRVLSDQLKVEAETGLYEKYNIHPFDDLTRALAARPDAVLVCNPSALHLPVASAAANAGCHLFIEKPLSHTLDGVDELIRCTRQKNLAALVGYQMRFHPCLRVAREVLAQDILGRIVAARVMVGEYLPNWHTFEDYRQTYGARRDLGGGALLSQIHEFDYVYWFFGLPTRLWTLGGHLTRLEIDVEDVASTLMEYRRAEYAFPVHVQQDYAQRPPTRRCEIVGELGRIEIDLTVPYLRRYDERGQLAQSLEFPQWARNQLFLDEMKHFVECVEHRAEPVVDLAEGAASLRMALAARASLEHGTVVEL